MQSQLERDTADAAADLRAALARNLQNIQALQALPQGGAQWQAQANALLREHRELVGIEWRDRALNVQAQAQSPFFSPREGRGNGDSAHSDTALACANARRLSGAAYSSSYFQPQGAGLGVEMMELCLPMPAAARTGGYLVVTYSLQNMLAELVGHNLRAAPGSVVHRSRWHPPGDGGRGAARHAHVHRAAAARPARQHPGAAPGRLARCARACSRTCSRRW